MQHSITARAIEQALIRLLHATGTAVEANDISVALTQYSEPALFAVIVSPHLRDALSRALMKLSGRLWAPHWEVWILSEVDARHFLLDASPDV
jgi:hypothetical protein